MNKIFGVVDKTEKVWWWVRHHAIALAFCVTAVLLVVWFVGSRSAYVIIEDSREKPRTYKAGIRLLTQYEIPDPNYVHSSPQLVSLICADGSKLFVTQMTVVLVGECD